MAGALVVSCTAPTGAGGDNVAATPAPVVFPVLFNFDTKAQADVFTAAAGYNGLANPAVAFDSTHQSATKGGTGCLDMTYGGSAAFGTTEVFTPLTSTTNWKDYTGIEFDIRQTGSASKYENILIVIRNSDTSANSGKVQAWKYETYTYGDRSTDDPTLWATVQVAFADFTAPGWGEVNLDASLPAAFTTGTTVFSQLNINPLVNQGVVGSLNHMYVDNIRLYK